MSWTGVRGAYPRMRIARAPLLVPSCEPQFTTAVASWLSLNDPVAWLITHQKNQDGGASASQVHDRSQSL